MRHGARRCCSSGCPTERVRGTPSSGRRSALQFARPTRARATRCDTVRWVITSRENETLRLVRKLLGQRKHRDGTGLFAAEGEDLVDAARDARIEPVHLLVAGETVEAGLLERVSTLPHPARVIGVYRRADLPTGSRQTCLALWHLARSRKRRDAPAHRRRVRRRRRTVGWVCRSAVSEGAARVGGRHLPRAARPLGRAPRPLRRARRPRRRPVTRRRPRAADHVPTRGRARRPARERIAECDRATISLSGDAESLNVAAAGAIALYELSRRQAEGRERV